MSLLPEDAILRMILASFAFSWILMVRILAVVWFLLVSGHKVLKVIIAPIL